MARKTTYDVVWPRGRRQRDQVPAAGRLPTLNGKKVAQLWDYLFRGDEVFQTLEEGLRARFPQVEFVNWREFGSTHSQDERQTLAELAVKFKDAGVDAAISGMGC
jgi:hypothetical protein